jgi:hypothetical protein
MVSGATKPKVEALVQIQVKLLFFIKGRISHY